MKLTNQLTFRDIQVNPTVLPADRLRLGGQNLKVYKRLLHGPASNVVLQRLTHSLNPSARISDVREALEPFGKTVAIIRKVGGGVNVYGIVEL